MIIEDISTGIDIEKVERFNKYADDRNSEFLTRIFSKEEIDYCFSYKNPSEHLAVRFCAKEAVFKALSALGINDIYITDIFVEKNENGVPFVKINKEGFEKFSFRLSLSHNRETAAASVVVIKE